MGKRKLVFFFEKQQQIAGSLIFMLKLAKYIAHSGIYDEVCYVNLPNREVEEAYYDESVQYYNPTTVDFSIFEDADFIVPLNYLSLFFTHVKDVIHRGRILGFDWHAQSVYYLDNQFPVHWNACEQLLPELSRMNSLAFMDRGCQLSAEKWINQKICNQFVPVFCVDEKKEYVAHEIVKNDQLNIGLLGRLDSDKIYALVNLLDNLNNLDTDIPICVHIIGDGDAKDRIHESDYKGKLNLVFTSYLVGKPRDEYIMRNIDLMVTMGISALDCANLSIPTVIAPVGIKQFYNNEYTFVSDVTGYSLGWNHDDMEELNLPRFPIHEIIGQVYRSGGKADLGKRCYDFCANNFDLAYSAQKLVQCVQNSKLSVDILGKLPTMEKQLHLYHTCQCLHKPFHYDYNCYCGFIGRCNSNSECSPLHRGIFVTQEIIRLVAAPFFRILRMAKRFLYQYVDRYRQKKKFIQIQNSFPIKIEYIRKQYDGTIPAPVAHLVMYDTSFASQPIFEKMLDNPHYDPYIIVIPDVQRSVRHMIRTYRKTYETLHRAYGERVIHGYDEKTAGKLELHENYPIVFFNNPYIRMAHPFHHEEYFRDKNVLTLYANYGFFTLKYGRRIVKTPFYNAIWKVCIDSQENFIDLQKHQQIRGQNAFVTGYIKMDHLPESTSTSSTQKTIIIAPHHTVTGWKALDISNFLKYSNYFLELPSMYPQIDFVFRPHPLLFNNLLENNIWSNQQINAYIDKMNSFPNARYDNSAEYLELFAHSDAIIHDCGSYIGEYLFTEKPCCYMLKSRRQIERTLLPMGKKCMENYYHAYSEADICHFIDDVVLAGNDPLCEQRKNFSRKHLKFNYRHAADSVIELLERTLGFN